MVRYALRHPLESANWGLSRVLPPEIHLALYELYCKSAPHKNSISVNPGESMIHIQNDDTGDGYYFPRGTWVYEAEMVEKGYEEELLDRYTLEDFVTVSKNDVVVDIGAFVGACSLAMNSTAAEVYSFEPSPTAYPALLRNTKSYDSIFTHNIAASDQSSELEFNLGANPTDGTVLTPDHGVADTVTIDARRLDEHISLPDKVDFLKVEAEGAEPEVLKGAAGLDIQKIAVDCSPERNGESPTEEVVDLLQGRGYETRKERDMVYARRR